MAKTRRLKRDKVALPREGKPEHNEPKFRLRPQRPKTSAQGDMAWAVALRTVYRYARSSARRKGGGDSSVRTGRRSFDQRCAVRVTYSPNRAKGQWRAHGIYIARESATQETSRAGFGDTGRDIDVADTLRGWQESGDQRMWKIIVSPEVGERLDLERLTRDIIKQAERDLGTPLEWVAVTHFNTEHPHIHLVVRGRRAAGAPLTLPRAYVQHGLRNAASKACTLQLGPRTELDAIAAEEREVSERRYTSLDRAIERLAQDAGDSRFIQLRTMSGIVDVRQQHVISRLAVLQTMGLAEPFAVDRWRVRRDFQTVLRAMQRANDRQKMLAGKGSLLSDSRLQIVETNARRAREVEGRVLLHGEEEQGIRHYMLLEGIDARVHLLYYTPEMEDARSQGKLRVNSFVRLRRQFVNGQPLLEIDDRGDANAVLKNKAFLTDSAQRLTKRGLLPTEDGWGGWLGAYQNAVRNVASREMALYRGKRIPNER